MNFKKTNSIIKNVIIFLFIFLLSYFSVFAEINIELTSSNTWITLEDEFELEVKIISDFDFEWGEIKIVWLDSFYQTAQKNFSQFTNINWETKQIQTIQIWFYPNKIWNFIIWPAIIWEWENEIKSNTIKIKVSDFISKKLENNEENIDLSSVWNENNLEEKNEEELKDIEKFNYSIYDFNYVFLIVLLLLILLYIYNKKDISNFISKDDNKPKIDFEKIIITKLKNLKKESNITQKNLFFEELNLIFREYFKYIWIKDSHIKTFEELFKDIENKNILSLFKESYYNEFNSLKEDSKKRIKLIDDFIKEIK